MIQLLRHGRTVATFFDRLGSRENDMTDALAYALSRSPVFLRYLVSDLGYEIITNPHTVFPEAPDDTSWGPHYCVKLGPPIVPARDVPSGPRVPRNTKVWCIIDTLLTAPTISDALSQTEKRESKPGRS